MQYTLSAIPTLPKQGQLILGVFSDELTKRQSLKPWEMLFNQANQLIFQRLLTKLTAEGDCVAQAEIEECNLLLIHCGNKEQFNAQSLKARLNEVSNWLLKQSGTSATIAFPLLIDQTPEWQLNSMIQQLEYNSYQLLDYKQNAKNSHKIAHIDFVFADLNNHHLKRPTAIAHGMNLTRTLANLPANVCTPHFLAHQAQDLSQQYSSIQTTILEREDIQELGMNAFLAVNQGSHNPPCFIEMQYKGAGEVTQGPIVLIGKGVTFDSGGISIKPAENMNEMKYDMGGAASVFGAIKACAELQLPLQVIGLIPATENMPGGGAVKPGDIVTSMSGQTIEITNTDAEGRLLLADALTYAKRFNPYFVLDMATLTGAMIIALGYHTTGYMTQDEELAAWIKQAAASGSDKAWRLPLEDTYQDALDSPLADMINAPFNRAAGSITAACFLARFAKGLRWAHLDIAGTAWVSGKQNHATGRPVSLLVHLLEQVAKDRGHH